jgi:tricorn protease
MKAIASVVAVFLGFAAASASARAQAAPETLLLQEPDIAGDRVVFVYAKDLWIASATGGEAKRLTSSTGDESNPRFSPDGQWIAFTGQYAGNPDVYVIPASGGDPKRLTWHPSGDTVQDWTRDGSAVVFTSARTSGGRQPPKLYTVPVSGGPATAYKIPRVVNAQLSLDGTRVRLHADGRSVPELEALPRRSIDARVGLRHREQRRQGSPPRQRVRRVAVLGR